MPKAIPLEFVDSPLFDTLSIPLGFTSEDRARMFVDPIGAMAPDPRGISGERHPKLWTETNMYLSSQLPAPNRFTVDSIRAVLLDRHGELVRPCSRFYHAAVLELRIAQKTYYQAPLWRVLDPLAVLATTAEAFCVAFDREERAELIRALRLQFGYAARPVIGVCQPFCVELTFNEDRAPWHRVDAPGTLVVLLEGLLERAIL